MKTNKLKTALKVFATFFKIGAFTFGGGYAMIPLIEREASEKNKWVTKDDILNIIAIAESTPGPIAINSATFVGYRACGVLGSAAATLGVVLPSFIIISVIAFLLGEFGDLKAVQYAFFGIRAGVLALVLKALWSMFQKNTKNPFAYGVMVAAFVSVAFLDLGILPVIICCAAAGVIAAAVERRKGEKQ